MAEGTWIRSDGMRRVPAGPKKEQTKARILEMFGDLERDHANEITTAVERARDDAQANVGELREAIRRELEEEYAARVRQVEDQASNLVADYQDKIAYLEGEIRSLRDALEKAHKKGAQRANRAQGG